MFSKLAIIALVSKETKAMAWDNASQAEGLARSLNLSSESWEDSVPMRDIPVVIQELMRSKGLIKNTSNDASIGGLALTLSVAGKVTDDHTTYMRGVKAKAKAKAKRRAMKDAWVRKNTRTNIMADAMVLANIA